MLHKVSLVICYQQFVVLLLLHNISLVFQYPCYIHRLKAKIQPLRTAFENKETTYSLLFV